MYETCIGVSDELPRRRAREANCISCATTGRIMAAFRRGKKKVATMGIASPDWRSRLPCKDLGRSSERSDSAAPIEWYDWRRVLSRWDLWSICGLFICGYASMV
jgi:hypothetical protein